ncbi:M28 family peptidase [Amycolatopsis sp. cg5]|uniref:M28 family peptidase n=1 Tax=Amycolatopsis sp. cg5 TaxID=3238802 RepID=UPI003525F333
MRLVLFDLGNTLEQNDILLPGALETLRAISELPAAKLALLSDFDMPATPADIPEIRDRYYAILDKLGIRSFFEPLEERVTLSTDVGVFKPDKRVFAAAAGKVGLEFADVFFVTENAGHVRAAKALGMRAVQLGADIDSLAEVLPLLVDETTVFRTTPDAIPAGFRWVRMGDAVLAAGPRADVSNLRLVTQNGRLFQEEHPEVPILLDSGRYLIAAGDIPQPGSPYEPCYSVKPVPWDTVVLERRAPTAGRAPVAWVQACVDKVTREPFEQDLTKLVSFTSRHSTGPGFDAAATWAASELSAAGYGVTTESVPLGGKTTRNVIADRLGDNRAPHALVVVTAHLDSINLAGGPAPGADDNGSGSAGVLAIARALAGVQFRHDLRFILFGGEEQGLFGSLRHVAGLPAEERSRISAVVNMDMIGTLNSPPPSVLLEGAAVSQHVIDGLAEAAATYTSLAVQTSLHPFNSDHVPFIDEGMPAVLTIEGADGANTHVHSARDTLEFIDYGLAVEILRMNVAYVAGLLELG